MYIKLGNGNIEMGAVRLANGNWAVLLQTHDEAHKIGESANSAGQDYVPTERDVVIEIGNVESGRVLQDAVNHTLLYAVGHIPPTEIKFKSPTPKVQLIKDARPEFPCEMYDTATEQWSRRESIDDRFTRLDIHNERLTHWRPLVPDAPMEAPFLRRSRMGRCNSPKCEPLHPSPAASKDGWSDQTGTSFEGEFKPIAMTQSFPLPTTDEAIAFEAWLATQNMPMQTAVLCAAWKAGIAFARSTPSPSQDTEDTLTGAESLLREILREQPVSIDCRRHVFNFLEKLDAARNSPSSHRREIR